MSTRFNVKDAKNYGVSGVNSGYDSNVKSDLSIPSCGVEDVDVALFNLFEKEIVPMVGGLDSSELKKVPIIFAAGEKWALLKKGKPLRDKTNTLILPLITIMRTGVSQDKNDISGRGINQQTGEIIVKRRLDKSDRDYQNLINKFLILNQTNLAVSGSSDPSQLDTSRTTGQLKNEKFVIDGGLLTSNRKNNIFETIAVPSPQFYTATYEINIWTQYTQHMNQIIEKLISSFLPQAQSWKLTTEKGYWFIATVDVTGFPIENNFEDMSMSERFIKCKIILKVPAYIWMSNAPGIPVPVKRYISSPIIDFVITSRSTSLGEEGSEEYVPLLGNDDPTLPLDEKTNLKDDQRRPGWRQQVVQPSNSEIAVDENDPALTTYPRGINPSRYKKIQVGNGYKYVKIVSVNEATGETVYSASDFEGIKFIII